MFQPKISIITVSYNSEETIERTILSVINQEYLNLEYIIIDGGSTDGTIDIIRKYEKSISYWVSEGDRGISDAFNKGISVATGEIIGIINSDDGLYDNALKTIAKNYDSEVGVYRGNVSLWNTETNYQCIEKPTMNFSKIPFVINISHQSTFIRKDIYEKYGCFDENCKYAMDYDLLLRLYNSKVTFKHVDKVLAYYTLGGLTFTNYNRKRYMENKYILKKNGFSEYAIALYMIVKRIKVIINKMVPKDYLLKIRH